MIVNIAQVSRNVIILKPLSFFLGPHYFTDLTADSNPGAAKRGLIEDMSYWWLMIGSQRH